MPSDFKNSFQQKAWEHAAQFHATYSRFLRSCTDEHLRGLFEKRIKEFESQFPQLKEGASHVHDQ